MPEDPYHQFIIEQQTTHGVQLVLWTKAPPPTNNLDYNANNK